MDLKNFACAALIAAAFVSWPNLAKPLGLERTPGLVPFIVLVVALVTSILMAPRDVAALRTISLKPLMIILAFGVVNGVATYLYAAKSADKNIQTGMFLVMVYVLMMFCSPIADWLINHKLPSRLQFIGIVLAAPVMWLLAQSPKK